jgi:exodeoxyribonuclease-3
MRIVTYNVNGIRSAVSKGFVDWLKATDADVVCLQEIKCAEADFDQKPFRELGYDVHLHPAVKKGYSGVAILTRHQPDSTCIGCGIEEYDREGRVLRADYGDISVISVYMPSGSSGDERQAFKMRWLDDFLVYIENLRKERPKLVICGDYNICHQPIDIHNPKSNANSSGFLPEEREWMTKFLGHGYADAFRLRNQEPHQYTWWSFRAGARGKNLGWRIDYHMVTDNLKENVSRALILPEAKHSDHCPVLIELAL